MNVWSGCSEVTDRSFSPREEEESTDVSLADRLSEAEEKIKVLHSCKWFKHWHVF